MPPLLEDTAQKPMRSLAYGAPKSKKTWWAAKAAEAGYNVILVDGDDGTHILNNLTAEAKERVQIIDAVDSLNKSVMSVFMVHLLKGAPFVWDENAKAKIINMGGAKEDHAHYVFDVSRFTMNDVLIVDSWTALAWSIAFRYSTENSIDLTDAHKTEWEGYRWAGALCNWMLNQMSALKCHVIVIAHQDDYEKKKADGKSIKFARIQPKSISGPHGMQLAKHFSDVLYFKIQGTVFKIDATAEKDRDGGSRNIEPKVYNWDDLQFADIIKAAGYPSVSPKPCDAVTYFKPGEELHIEGITMNSKSAVKGKPLQATTAAKPKTGGASLTSLLKKK